MNLLPWRSKNLSEVWTWPHIFWVNIFGWWGEEARSSFGRRWLPKLRQMELFYVILMAASMVVAIVEKFAMGDIMTNMFTVFGSGPGIVGLFKIFQIVRHRKTLKSVMDELDGLLVEVNSPYAEQIMRNAFNTSWIIFLISLISGSCITLHWLSRPLLMAAFYGEKTRIVDTWPVFIDSWVDFALSYLWQLILTHLEVLKYRLENLKLLPGSEKSQELISCVRYHTAILRICNKLRDASSAVIIWQCINTVIMACSGVFIVTMIKNLTANLVINLGEIIIIITVTLYFYCWFSNEMTFQCGNLMSSAYKSNWTGGREGDKRSLHILMTRTVPPVYFGGILEISLNTFITVLKTTFSYYNFLIAVNNEDE